MRLRTRFIIAIAATLTGFITISGLTVFLIMGINRLNRADTVCNDTINTLRQFQLVTTQLLTTQEMDKTFVPVITLMILGVSFTSGLKWLERRIAPWSHAQR